MDKKESMVLTYGEMMDLINCYNVEMGRAEPKSINRYDDMASALLLE